MINAAANNDHYYYKGDVSIMILVRMMIAI